MMFYHFVSEDKRYFDGLLTFLTCESESLDKIVNLILTAVGPLKLF